MKRLLIPQKRLFVPQKQRLLILFLFAVSVSFGARKLPPVPVFTPADSLQVVQLEWKTKEVAPGIVFKQAFDPQLFGKAPQHISIVEIDPVKAKVQLYIGLTERCALTSETAKSKEALAAINGSFFHVKDEYPVNYLKLDGKMLFPTTKSEGTLRATGAILIDQKARVDIIPWSLELEAGNGHPAENILVSGPLLLHESKTVPLVAKEFALYRHPRTAFGITKSGNYIFFVVDGRFSNLSEGMNLFEMAYFARVSGYLSFINLDGGGSTTLWINGGPGSGVVNHPCDNNRFDNKGERKVSTMLYVK